MNEDHIFHEYMRQNSGLMAQLQELVLSLSKSFQGLNTQHQQLLQRFQTTQHRDEIVLYTLLRHDEDLRMNLRQTLDRLTNPFQRESPEYKEFKGAITSLKTLIRQCQRAASGQQQSTPQPFETAPQQPDDYDILRLQAHAIDMYLDDLVTLLIDSVNGGASIGFLPPIDQETVKHYWHEVEDEMQRGQKDLLILSKDQQLVGAIQLAYSPKPNARHRAEVQKLLVHSQHRRQGYAQQLMYAAEKHAGEHGRTLLVLDTRKGDAAEQLYLKLGYRKAGEIPQYARSADGNLHTSVFFYKLLDEDCDEYYDASGESQKKGEYCESARLF